MAVTIEQQLNQLLIDKETLINNLISQGVEASNEDTFTTLAPKVLDIQKGEDSVSDEWKPDSSWWDIDKVYQEFIETHPEYPYIAVYLLKSDEKEITNVKWVGGFNMLKSDGETVEIPSTGGSSKEFSFSWDLTKDKDTPYGYKTRYVVLYSKNSLDNLIKTASYNPFHKMLGLYLITSPELTIKFRGTGSSNTFSRQPMLKAIKFMTNDNGDFYAGALYKIKDNGNSSSLEAVFSDKPFNFLKYGTNYNYPIISGGLKYPMKVKGYPDDLIIQYKDFDIKNEKIQRVIPNIKGTGESLFTSINCHKIIVNPGELTTFKSLFSSSRFYQLNDDNILDCTGIKDVSSCFNGHKGLNELTLINSENVESWSNFLDNYSSISKLTVDVSSANSIAYAFNSFGLNELRFKGIIPKSFQITYVSYLTEENLIDILNHLADLTGQTSQNVSMGSTLKSKLEATTAGQEALVSATNKNWTIS